MNLRLFYMDDSGSPQTRCVVFGWLELQITEWKTTLRRVLDWRNELHRTIGIPTDYELHATKFIGGRGNPTKNPAWDGRDDERVRVAGELLGQVAALPAVDVGAVYTRASTGRDFRDLKARTYAELVRTLDERLATAGELGLIVMDGDGTDPTYREAHRELKLATRNLIEDPFFHGSDHSQWVQLADFIAYAAYMHLVQLPTKEPTWRWFEEILGTRAVTGPTPLELPATRKDP